MSLTTRPFIVDDAVSLAPRLREADLREIDALGQDPLSALLGGVASKPGLVIVPECDLEWPLAAFGVEPAEYGRKVGYIWMLATDELVEGHSIEFLRKSRDWVDWLNTRYSVLTNIMDARNTVHSRWLEWCKFVFTYPLIINNRKFLKFKRVR